MGSARGEWLTGRAPRLALIATGAGLFSGLFGVGGGTVMVPLLVLWLAYEARQATATSLAAIIFIAGIAAAVQAAYGNVHVLDAAVVGLPAIAGVVAGTWLQQRIATRAIAILFAAVLLATAIELLLR